ncbi:MAG: phosphoserine phosphatase SerB [Nocardioides alkalitolerans]
MSAPADPSQPRPTDGGPAHPEPHASPRPSPGAAFPAGAPGAERTLLLTVTGKDRPGVTTSMLSVLARAGVDVLDVEQIVLRGRLVLGLLVTAPEAPADVDRLRDDVTRAATEVGMQVEVEQGTGDNHSRGAGRVHVSVIGAPLRAEALGEITGRIADAGANIDRIERMARYPVTAIDLHVSGADPERLRLSLAAEAARQGVDVAVQPANLLRRSMRLIVMDVDSTLIQGEVIEMLAAHAGCEDEVAAVTEAAMRGEIDFEESLRQRVARLAGVEATALDEVYAGIRLAPGARTMVRTLKRLGYRFAIVSGGFSQITDRLAADLGIDFARANELEIVDGRLTGRIVGPVVDRAGKATALRQFAAEVGIPVESVIAVGDGANDLDMLGAAGLGIAFNAKPAVREAAEVAVNVPYLDTIIYLLGISREDVEAADAAAGLVTPAPVAG